VQTELLERLRRGDDDAFADVVRAHAGRLLAVARRILRDEEEARDAVQDAFTRAFKAIADFEGRSELGTWLHRIAVTSALMRQRQRRGKDTVSLDALMPRFKEDGHRVLPEDPWSEPGDLSAERAETRRLVRDSIERLPDEYREVVLLRDVEQMDTRQAAEVLGLSEAAVKTRLHRARLALRGQLERLYRSGGL